MTGDARRTYVIRPLRRDETEVLKDFLYEAIFVPEGMEPPDRDILEKPELRVYTDGFGTRKGDNCLVAESTRRRPSPFRCIRHIAVRASAPS